MVCFKADKENFTGEVKGFVGNHPKAVVAGVVYLSQV